MNDRGSDRFFAELFKDLKPAFYWRHPSEQTWREYLAQQIKNDAPQAPGELLRWKSDQLQLEHHRLTCSRCARQLARLRLRQAAQPAAQWKPAWQFSSTVGYGALAVLLIAVGLWISIPRVLPPPIPQPNVVEQPAGGGFGSGGG